MKLLLKKMYISPYDAGIMPHIDGELFGVYAATPEHDRTHQYHTN